jgi:thiol:disulfide interchange protein
VPQSTTDSPPDSTAAYRAPDSEVTISGRLEPAAVQPGETAQITITATPTSGWHVYAHSDRDNQRGSKPTLIAFENAWGLAISRPVTESPIITDSSIPNFPTMRYHEGPVTWTIDVDVPKEAEAGSYRLSGIIGYMACKDLAGGVCELPKGVRFQTVLDVGEAAGAASGELAFWPATYPQASAAAGAWAEVLEGQPSTAATQAIAASSGPPTAADGPPYDLSRVQVADQSGSLGYYIAIAFVGGLILNLMPCVLPVIGLKVMSFVQQAGKSRRHALALNLWYSGGIVAVFLLLGMLAATVGLAWGGQFGNTTFNVIIAAVVFAMALSLLGVWEVPIPGFFGTGAVQEAAAKEGPTGAFVKGIVTTILATPCGAPYMAPAIGWAVGQPTTTTLAVFASVGAGMASPYLVVGVFPELLRFMPKPGRWMEIFKQLTGFVLLATVVFILSFLEPAAVVPTVLLLVGIGMACWYVAHRPVAGRWIERANTWSTAGLILLLFTIASFGWLYPQIMWPRYGGLQSAAPAGWQPFSLSNLQKVAVEEGRTVIVDFSADWCFNCKVFEAVELHTLPVESAIAGAGAVKMYADFTEEPQVLKDTLKALKSNGVPVIAIFSGDRPYEPIVFRGGYTKAGIVEALGRTTSRDPVASSGNAAIQASVRP